MGRIVASPSPFRWVWLVLVASTALAGPVDDPKPKGSDPRKAGTSKSRAAGKVKPKAADASPDSGGA